MKKMILPKYVAEAIETLLEKYFNGSKSTLFNTLTVGIGDHTPTEARIVFEYFKDDFDRLMMVLVNGYEIELSREEKVAEYMKQFNRMHFPYGTSWSEPEVNENIKTIVADVLNILDVKIEGLNQEVANSDMNDDVMYEY